MASVVLAASSDYLWATGAIFGAGGVQSSGTIQSEAVIVQAESSESSILTIRATAPNAGTPGNVASLVLSETKGALSQIAYQWDLGCGGVGVGAIPEGVLQLTSYENAAFAQTLVSVGPVPRAATDAIFGLTSALQSGVATIPLGAATIAVLIPGLTATGIVMITPTQAPDATCIDLRVPTPAAGTFSITGAAAATAPVLVNWFVVHL
jgi:hypothetical protein